MSKVSHAFKGLVAQLDDRTLEHKVKQMREQAAQLQTDAEYASRELRNRRKAGLKRARDET